MKALIECKFLIIMLILTLLILSSYSNFHALCAGGIVYYSPELLDDELESLGSLMKHD